MVETDTIVAPATPTGESAIGVIRVSGPLARETACALRNGRPPLPWRAWFGEYRAVDGSRIDEAVFTFFAAPKSYTGEDVLEISSHGNPFIIKRIVEDLCRRGCRMAEPGEFSRRAFLNGRMDLTRAEAVMDVIRARSERSLEFALRQLSGELERRMKDVVDRLLDICAGVEAYIDFPEEDLPPEEREQRIQEVDTLRADLDRLRGTVRSRTVLQEGMRVVLAGEPNAGKSTLFNRLVGMRRAIVSEEPGTTRDFIEHSILAGGHRIRLIDTAGVREAPGAVEREGVDLTLEQVAEADMVVLVIDGTSPSPALPLPLRERMAKPGAVVAVNKVDLGADAEIEAIGAPEVVRVSALTGEGVDDLLDRIVARAEELVGAGADDEGVAVNERHSAALADAVVCLDRARELLVNDADLELAASELRGAVDAVGRIVGRIDNEAMLDHLFSRFCIGK